MENQKCVIKYQIATYSGEETVYCNENDENEYIIGKAKKQLSRNAPLPFGCQCFKIIGREYCR